MPPGEPAWTFSFELNKPLEIKLITAAVIKPEDMKERPIMLVSKHLFPCRLIKRLPLLM